MNAIVLSPTDLIVASALIVFDAILSLILRLNLHRQLVWAAIRMVVQLVAVGYILRWVFSMHHPGLTVVVVVAMSAIAAREIAARPERKFKGWVGLTISGIGVALATVVTVGLALTTAIRPTPWYDARYAIPLAGIVLGSVLNAGSLTLDTLLGDARREKTAIEAQLALGATYAAAMAPLLRNSVRRGLLPIINQMSAAGLITLPGIMTGQIIAGEDPIEAVKYQILLMFLLAGASGLTGLTVAGLAAHQLSDGRQRLRLDKLR